MLTGKDVYEACYARQQRDGFGTLDWNDLPSETHAFWQEIAQSLNDAHIAPLQGLLEDYMEFSKYATPLLKRGRLEWESQSANLAIRAQALLAAKEQ